MVSECQSVGLMTHAHVDVTLEQVLFRVELEVEEWVFAT